jgi:hypothetical protein
MPDRHPPRGTFGSATRPSDVNGTEKVVTLAPGALASATIDIVDAAAPHHRRRARRPRHHLAGPPGADLVVVVLTQRMFGGPDAVPRVHADLQEAAFDALADK